jgi:hypothetical protein
MESLENMSIGQRIAVMVVIVLLALVLLALWGLAFGEEKQPQPTALYGDIPFDATLLRLDRRALEEAYHNQLVNLWTVWLKGQAGDPTYMINGLRIARRAYGQAAGQIAKREQQLIEQENQK